MRRGWGVFFLLVGWACGSEPAPRHFVYNLAPLGPLLLNDTRRPRFTGAHRPLDEQALSWMSTNPDIAAVDSQGRIQGRRPGIVTILAQDDAGQAQIRLQVSSAGLSWSLPLDLRPRAFLAAARDGWAYVKVVTSAVCDVACEGRLMIIDPDGHVARILDRVGRFLVAANELWFEHASEVRRIDLTVSDGFQSYAADALLGRFQNGDVLVTHGRDLLRLTKGGTIVINWHMDAPVKRAVILDDARMVVQAGSVMAWLNALGLEPIEHGSDRLPWAADHAGQLIASDRYAYSFMLYGDIFGRQWLASSFSVLVGPGERIIQSEGLNAQMAVPVIAQEDGTNTYLELTTWGNHPDDWSIDLVSRRNDIRFWRAGPFKCADHPFAVAAQKGFLIVADCNRVLRISDRHMKPAGAWPQAGADGGRSWLVQSVTP